MKTTSKYQQIIEKIFGDHYKQGDTSVEFHRDDIADAAKTLGISIAKNLGDVVYSYRYRRKLPDSIVRHAPKGKEWVIVGIGTSKYRFELRKQSKFEPNANLAETKIPDATPGIVSMYAQSDEQALLAKIRYNRLVDIFLRIACYSIQNHFRTSVDDIGQVETDELYVGIDRKGTHYVIPVQAKGGTDKLGVTQIEQDFALCKDKFPSLVCRSVAAQFITNDKIAMFEFEQKRSSVKIVRECHYRLVPADDIEEEDIERYRDRTDD